MFYSLKNIIFFFIRLRLQIYIYFITNTYEFLIYFYFARTTILKYCGKSFRGNKKTLFKIYPLKTKKKNLKAFLRNENNSRETPTPAIDEIILTSKQEQAEERRDCWEMWPIPLTQKEKNDIKQNLSTGLEKLIRWYMKLMKVFLYRFLETTLILTLTLQYQILLFRYFWK